MGLLVPYTIDFLRKGEYNNSIAKAILSKEVTPLV